MAKQPKSLFRKLLPRVLWATVKSIIVLVVFMIVSQLLAPLEQVVPGVVMLLEIYCIVYVVFIFTGELTKGTIYQYALNIGKAFFFIGYSVYALNNGTFSASVESITFSINVQIFLMMIILIGMLDFAKNLLHIVNYLANKAETEEITVALPEQEIPA